MAKSTYKPKLMSHKWFNCAATYTFKSFMSSRCNNRKLVGYSVKAGWDVTGK